ncbi:MAG: hypothetical protein ACPHID_01950 [Thermoplasmatota archaeon]
MTEEAQPPQIPDKTWNDLEEAQALLSKCAEYGFPLDKLLDGDDEAEHYLELFLEFNRGIVHGLSRPNEPWRGAKTFLLPEFRGSGPMHC